MRSAIVGFVAGVALLHQQPSLLAVGHLALLLIVTLSVVFLVARQPRLPVRVAGFFLVGAATGFAWAGLYAQHALSDTLPPEWEGRDVTLIGTIDSLPYYFERGVRFNFSVERVVSNDNPAPSIPNRLALSWYSDFRADAVETAGEINPGERWQFTVRLRRPHGNANPYGFDYEVWLLEQGLRATGYVRPDRGARLKNQRLDNFVFSFGNVVERSRAWLRDRIYAALPEKRYAGVIVALVIGDQRAIGQPDWEIFNRTGVGHLISISGLHITMISGLFASAAFGLWRRSFFSGARLPLKVPAQKVAALAGALAALIYVLLAGFGIPAQRTLYMISVVAMALWLGRLSNVSHVLCLALGVVALVDPWAVLWPGFWLSFGAVGIMLFASAGRINLRSDQHVGIAVSATHAIRTAARTQYVVTVGLVPLTVLLFGQVSLIGPIANAAAIPLVSFIVTPLSLVGSFMPSMPGALILGMAHWCMEMLAELLAWLSQFPGGVWRAPVPDWAPFFAALAGTLWLLAPRGWPARWLGLAGLIPMIFSTPSHPREGEMWITAFDVGQGTALLIESSNRRLLYDTGPAYSPESDGGSRIILPYLRARGIHRLDGMIVSHSDHDHAGGALSILNEIDVEWVSSSLPEGHPVSARAARHQRCEAGQAWDWDGARFEMLHPEPGDYDNRRWKPNGRSCTLKITLGEHSVLLPGDIEAVQEAALVNKMPHQLKSSVLVVPHHGSGTSSTPAFLDKVRPEIALFQLGYRNRYRHPKEEVYERYGVRGIQRLRSDDSGAVTIHLGAEIVVSEYRKDRPRYWHSH